MMGKNKAVDSLASQEKINTLVGVGAVFNGDLIVPDTVRVDGTVNGNCTCKGTLILGVEGNVVGNIQAQNVFISGKVKGDISSSGRLEILSSGRVAGDISARRLVIDEDAYFDGRCTMTNENAGQGHKEENKK
ncbi:MAG: polymer-forming cytoskeletal protein [Lachnospiraceae bacterium]|nr:polymer-forming cytoskeletal protein [Lachnospiraceae bacterium]